VGEGDESVGNFGGEAVGLGEVVRLVPGAGHLPGHPQGRDLLPVRRLEFGGQPRTEVVVVVFRRPGPGFRPVPVRGVFPQEGAMTWGLSRG